MKIGVLALQGDFARHKAALRRIGVEPDEVKKPGELDAVSGLIIPGGESTTLLKLMDAGPFVPALEKFHADGRPIFGTCAGLIDVAVERNAYGRQKESFEAEGQACLDGAAGPLTMVFIRAPRIRRLGPRVASLASHRGECVMAREGSVLVATFHPELTDDPTVHRYFAEMVRYAAL